MKRMRLDIQLFASGTIAETSSPSAGNIRITWTSTLNAGANTSSVTATVQIQRVASGTTTGTFSGNVKIDGTSYSISKYGSWSTTWTTVGSATKTVTHNEDGTKSINIQSTLEQAGTSLEGTYKAGTSGTANATLDNNNRASVLGVITDFGITDTKTIAITKYVAGYTDKLIISSGTTTIKTINSITNGYSLTFSAGEITTIKGLMTSPKINLTFTLSTYDGATQIGSNSVKTASVSSLDKPIMFNYIKKENGFYQMAINGIVDDNISDPLQVYDDSGNEILNEVVLYNNASGSATSLTLSETSANFTYCEIFYGLPGGVYGYNSAKIYSPNGKEAGLISIGQSNGYVYLNSAVATISGTNITISNDYRTRLATTPGITITSDVNQITIYRVVGFR